MNLYLDSKRKPNTDDGDEEEEEEGEDRNRRRVRGKFFQTILYHL